MYCDNLVAVGGGRIVCVWRGMQGRGLERGQGCGAREARAGTTRGGFNRHGLWVTWCQSLRPWSFSTGLAAGSEQGARAAACSAIDRGSRGRVLQHAPDLAQP